LIINIKQYSKFSHIKMSDCQKDNVPTLEHSFIYLLIDFQNPCTGVRPVDTRTVKE